MNAAILGAGAMGKVLAATIEEQEGAALAGIIEPRNGEVSCSDCNYRVFTGTAADDYRSGAAGAGSFFR